MGNFIGMFVQRYKAEEARKKDGSEEEKVTKSNGQKRSVEVEEEKEEPGSDSEVQEGNDVESEVKDVPKIILVLRRIRGKIPRVPELLIYDEAQYVVDRLDEISRKLFPFAFLVTSVAYWSYYFLLAEDLRSGPEIRQPDFSFLLE